MENPYKYPLLSCEYLAKSVWRGFSLFFFCDKFSSNENAIAIKVYLVDLIQVV